MASRRAWLGAVVGVLAASAAHGEAPAVGRRDPADWRVPERIVPLTTTTPVDGRLLDVRSPGQLRLGATVGRDVTGPPLLDGVARIESSIRERLKDGLYERRQRGWYAAIGTTPHRDTVTTRQEQAVTAYGFRLRFSIVGGCLGADAEPGSLCTFTPGLATNSAFLNPLLVPTRFVNTSSLGDPISPETYAAIQEPGFVRNAPGEPAIGLDLDIPNAGIEASRARGGLNRVHRSQSIRHHIVPSVLRADQALYSNARAARVTRTQRGAVLLHPDNWTLATAVTQVLALLLPTVDVRLPGGDETPNFQVNNNLFLAANNARLPAASFTVYHGGLSQVIHPEEPVADRHALPAAWFHGVWLGFTPVSERRVRRGQRIVTTAPRTTRTESFAQGGASLEASEALVEVTGLIEVIGTDGAIVPIPLQNIAARHVQIGLEFSEQQAVLRSTTRSETTTRLVPHLSLTGNRTDSRRVLRYFGGALLTEATRPNLYVGGDLRIATEGGTGASLGGVAHTRPDRDHFSRVTASLSHRFDLTEDHALVLGAAGGYGFDRTENNRVRVSDDTNRLSLSARLQTEGLALFARQDVAAIVPDAAASRTTLGLSLRPHQRLGLSAEITPISDRTSETVARVGVSWRLGDAPTDPTVDLSWRRDRYDFGSDPFGNRLRQHDDVFGITIQRRF